MSMTEIIGRTVAVGLLFSVVGQAQTAKLGNVRSADASSSVSRPVEPDSPTTSSGISAGPQAVVPRLMKFSGALHDAAGKKLSGTVDVTFSLYSSEAGGDALWFETQSVQADDLGRYTALLGAMHTDGLPVDLFTSGEIRWLGIQVANEPEQQPRVLLVSVPYALKAGDAETLGGKPASAYMLSDTQNGTPSTSGSTLTTGTTQTSASGKNSKTRTANTTPLTPACASVTSNSGGVGNSFALFDGTCDVKNSNITQLSNGNVGIGTASPTYPLDITGPTNTSIYLHGPGTHQFTIAGATSGRLGQDAAGFFFSSDTNGAAVRILTNNGTLHEWMRITSAGNVGVGTTTPAATLDVAGNANVSSSVTLGGNLNLPQTTNASAGVIRMGSNTLIHACCGSKGNLFEGISAGNFSLTGSNDTGTGVGALASVTTGNSNTANGYTALYQTTTGAYNTSTGAGSMYYNIDGVYNTANGYNALSSNTSGGGNTAIGAQALLFSTTGFNNTATGVSVLLHSNGNNNTGDGDQALYSTTTGSANTASGFEALYSNTMGNNNAAEGFEALYTNTAGNINAALGYEALYANSDASANTAVGAMALYYNCSGASSSCGAIDNTAVGYNAGVSGAYTNANKTGSFNTFLGANSGPGTTTQLTYATAIGADALVSQSNSLALGGVGGAAVKVGIGTPTPLASLQVASGDIVVGPVTALPYSSTNGVYVNNDGGDAKNTFRLDAYKNDLSISGYSVSGAATGTTITFRTAAAGAGESDRVRIDSSGRLGIGTDGPAYPLDVVGDIHTTGCVLYNGGSVGGCATPSDARLKMNIQPFGTVLERLVALQPVHFDWNPSNPPKYRYAPGRTPGLIAQNVEKVFPELVTTGEDGYKRVFYNELQFMLLEGVRELKAENNRLKDSVLVQETEIKKQQDQIKVQQALLQKQQAQLAQLASQVTVIQASLKAKPGTRRTARTAKAHHVEEKLASNRASNSPAM